jgi:beta-1,2-mannobiose phosphorylase / 1,2-beta-oligomannan phosphorylase
MSEETGGETPPFALQRLGVVMEPQPGDPNEAWGVLNPAAARGLDGELYLFPRLVAEGNYSRIGIARVVFDPAGIPAGVERLGLALEPREPYELNAQTGGGVEDPRVTLVQPLHLYVMAYTALGPAGPRVALATSPDLFHWTRLGPLRFAPEGRLDLNAYANKDAAFFPDVVADPHGHPALAVLHRPSLRVPTGPDVVGLADVPGRAGRESIWLSYVSLEPARRSPTALTETYGHKVLATPQQPWEALKIGGGPPPLRTPLGWLVIYHGVCGRSPSSTLVRPALSYSAGALVLDGDDVLTTRYRSPQPILAPELEEERFGIVPNCVFPTGLDPQARDAVDVYYGMADARIGAARLALPSTLPLPPPRRPGLPDDGSPSPLPEAC